MAENILLPEDIDSKEFTVSFRGYNTEEVDLFLHDIKASLSAGAAERDVLKRKVSAAELLAKDAQNHEEEYLRSIASDKEEAEMTLAAARSEGERIIREARNAAAGIMAEVRRRAGEMSGDCKREAESLLASAKAEAEGTVAAAEKDAEKALYSAKLEAENVVAAAKAERDAMLSATASECEAAKARAAAEAEKLVADARARRDAELHDVIELKNGAKQYADAVKEATDTACRELEAELQNSAARIAMLRRRAENRSEVSVPENIADAEKLASPSESAPIEPPVANDERDVKPAESDNGGYFSEEYHRVMKELFGAAENEPSGNDRFAAPAEDDDTYDYIGIASPAKESDSDIDFVNGVEATGDVVTSVYDGTDAADVFDGGDMVDGIYKPFDDDDINDILRGI